jgi:hypothetical protein
MSEGSFTGFHNFNISSNFIPGINTLDFLVRNFNGPGDNTTGLRVEILSATANGIPEPSSWVLLGLGAAGVFLAARRSVVVQSRPLRLRIVFYRKWESSITISTKWRNQLHLTKIVLFILLTASAVGFSGQAKADFLYELTASVVVDSFHPSDIYEVTGTINTDKDTGALLSSDITSWSWSATNGTTTFSLSSSDAQSRDFVHGSLIATPLNLSLPFPNLLQYNSLVLEVLDSSLDPPNRDIIYETDQAAAPDGYDSFVSLHNAPTFWGSRVDFGAIIDRPDSFVIATAVTQVPEPSSIGLLGIGTIGLAAVARRKIQKTSQLKPTPHTASQVHAFPSVATVARTLRAPVVAVN